MKKFLNSWGLGLLITIFYYITKFVAAIGLINKPISKDDIKESISFDKTEEDVEEEVESLSRIADNQDFSIDFEDQDYSLVEVEDDDDFYYCVLEMLGESIPDTKKEIVSILREETGMIYKDCNKVATRFIHLKKLNDEADSNDNDEAA